MPILKKIRVTTVSVHSISKREAIDALTILSWAAGRNFIMRFEQEEIELNSQTFYKIYGHSYLDTLEKIREKYVSLDADVKKKVFSADQLYEKYKKRLEKGPLKSLVDGKYQWFFEGNAYAVSGEYSDEQIRLLILEDFDKERRYFEKLKAKFDGLPLAKANYDRPRIPENVRIEVWRRDGGTCARCGSREKLEYDHIVPISKGGNNTVRNIELLCEKCNRSKSNNVA